MKKYNLSKIMKRAWELKRCNRCYTFSKCLHLSWDEAKRERKAAEEAEKLAAMKGTQFKQNMEITVGYTTYTLRRWQSYGKDRIYINVNAHRNIGYLDVKSGNIYGAPRRITAEAAKAHEIVKSLAI